MRIRELITYSFACNVGQADRAIRGLLGVGMLTAPWTLTLPRAVAIGVVVLGGMILATALVSRCALYHLLGLSTRSIKEISR